MNTIAIDTHKTIERLKKKGYTQDQAEGFVDALVESELASKQDLRELKSELTTTIYKALLVHGLAIAALLLAAIM